MRLMLFSLAWLTSSPSSDGLPMEFYVVFWDLLGGDLVNVFNASLEDGLLPFCQSEALIALISKIW